MYTWLRWLRCDKESLLSFVKVNYIFIKFQYHYTKHNPIFRKRESAIQTRHRLIACVSLSYGLHFLCRIYENISTWLCGTDSQDCGLCLPHKLPIDWWIDFNLTLAAFVTLWGISLAPFQTFSLNSAFGHYPSSKALSQGPEAGCQS